MAATTQHDVFVPEIATEVATAEFPKELALSFAGSPFVRTFPPEDRLGQEGDQVKFPRYNPLSEFVDMVAGTPLSPEKLDSSLDTAIVQVGGKAVEILDFASLAARGDPSVEVGRQVATLAARWADTKLIQEALTTELEADYSSQTITVEALLDAMQQHWGDRAFQNIGGIVLHSKVANDAMKLPEFKEADKRGAEGTAVRGRQAIGTLAGYPVFVSDRLTVSGGVYTNLILKQGALGMKFQRQLLVERDRDVLNKSWVIAADVRAAFHLFYAEPAPAIRFRTL